MAQEPAVCRWYAHWIVGMELRWIHDELRFDSQPDIQARNCGRNCFGLEKLRQHLHRTPQNNPEGYKRSAALNAAKDLHGKLLLIHGAIDDNVHMANTIQFAYELQKAGKQFELMLYPKSRHGVTDPLLLKHMRQMMTDFIVGNL